MAYAFEAGADGGAYPKLPEFWKWTGRIGQLFPDKPAFASFNSVITDPDTGHLGIDTNDRLPDQELLDHAKMRPIGILKVIRIDPPIDGFIVDLRHVNYLSERNMGIESEVSEEVAEQNVNCKTQPVLGAIFWGMKAGTLHFTCDAGLRHILEPCAAELAEFVDTTRSRQGVGVHDEAVAVRPELVQQEPSAPTE